MILEECANDKTLKILNLPEESLQEMLGTNCTKIIRIENNIADKNQQSLLQKISQDIICEIVYTYVNTYVGARVKWTI